MKRRIFSLLIFVELSLSLAPDEILVLILSQPNSYHLGLASNLQANIVQQSLALNESHLVHVEILHEVVDRPGYWTFLAILPSLLQTAPIAAQIKWIVLCEDRSHVNVRKLIDVLGELSWKQDVYIGYPLYDKEATIIHHFAFFERPQWFPYPLIRSGLAFSAPLIKKLTKRVQDEKPTSEFFIDASHELSLFIWQNIRVKTAATNGGTMMTTTLGRTMTTENNKLKSRADSTSTSPLSSVTLCHSQSCQNNDSDKVDDASDADRKSVRTRTRTQGNTETDTELYRTGDHKLLMTTSPYFCRLKGPECAIYAGETKATCNHNNKSVHVDEIYFAIKTYHKYHTERIPIIEETWGQYAVHKKYFSDVADKTIPTYSVNVPNTDIGHCAKTLSIFKLALKDIDKMNSRLARTIKWIFLCDDDTLLSVPRVCDMMSCFNATEHVYLGERYGYRLHSKDGFNYITGGGGMAISLPTARKIANLCSCPSASSPDDMIIGMCLQRLGITAIHSPRFHQARPVDYSLELLSINEPISFHKFWQLDPGRTYTKWFGAVDAKQLSKAQSIKQQQPICDIETSQSTNCVKEPKKRRNGAADKGETHHIEL